MKVHATALLLRGALLGAAILVPAAGRAIPVQPEENLPAPPVLQVSPAEQAESEIFRSVLTEHANFSKIIEAETLFGAVRPNASRGVGGGTVHVLISLNDPPTKRASKVDWDDDVDVKTWRLAVAERQEAVIGGFPKEFVDGAHKYTNFPVVSLDVDMDTLLTLMDDPRVAWIEPERYDTQFGAQAIPLMNGTTVRTTYRGAGMTIAILDSGVDYTHPELGNGGFPNSKVIMGIDTSGAGDADPIPEGSAHGTACAGIAGGSVPGGGSVGDFIGGVAPDAKIAAVKVFPAGSNPSASTTDIVEGIDWCVTNRLANPSNPIRVISMSLGGGEYTTRASCDSGNPTYVTAIAAAVNAGITVVAASGNNGFCASMSRPACVSSVISVGATYDANIGASPSSGGWCISNTSCFTPKTLNACGTGVAAAQDATTAGRKVTCYSNTATFLDILGPATNASTADIVGSSGYTTGNYTTTFGGTSAATPYIAGAIAALQSASFDKQGDFLTSEEMRTLLNSTGVSVTDTKNGGLSPGTALKFVDMQAAFDAIPTVSPTNPRKRDTDDDGFLDGLELRYPAVFPNGPTVTDVVADADSDGLPDVLDPNDANADSDGDRFRDEYEAACGTDCNSSSSRPPLGNVSGDYDSNGMAILDINDVILLANYNVGLTTLPDPSVADLNGDGIVDINDVIILANANVGQVLLPSY